jgi:hypothetical protein
MASQQVLEEGERTAPGCGDDLAAVGIDDCQRPVLRNGFGESRAKAL